MINITIKKEGLDLSIETLAMMRRVVAKVEKQVACIMVIEELEASQEPKKIEKNFKKTLDIASKPVIL